MVLHRAFLPERRQPPDLNVDQQQDVRRVAELLADYGYPETARHVERVLGTTVLDDDD